MDLFFIPVVAVAISLVICWSLFSLICSFLHEAIMQIKGERGRFMKKHLFRQFYDQPNGVNWASMLYMHGTVDLLTGSVSNPTSEINARLFARTLVEVVGKAHITQINRARFASQLPYKSDLLNDFRVATLSLQQSDIVSFFQQSLNTAELSMRPDGTADEQTVYNSLIDQIETWYKQLIERFSHWYKIRTRMRLFLLGTLLAILLNVDSIRLFQHFTSHPTSRQVMIEFYEENANRLNVQVKNVQNPAETRELKAQLAIYSQQMDSLAAAAELPIGWKQNIFSSDTWKTEKENRFFWGLLLFLSKMSGYLISGFAASSGAPFWFDVLKKAYTTKTTKR